VGLNWTAIQKAASKPVTLMGEAVTLHVPTLDQTVTGTTSYTYADKAVTAVPSVVPKDEEETAGIEKVEFIFDGKELDDQSVTLGPNHEVTWGGKRYHALGRASSVLAGSGAVRVEKHGGKTVFAAMLAEAPAS
jgi:hypothetical protein